MPTKAMVGIQGEFKEGKKVTINVDIKNAIYLKSLSINCELDSSLLQVDNITVSPILEKLGFNQVENASNDNKINYTFNSDNNKSGITGGYNLIKIEATMLKSEKVILNRNMFGLVVNDIEGKDIIIQQDDVIAENSFDILDLAYAANKYNMKKEDDKWNKYYDFIQDDIIDIFDLTYIAKQMTDRDSDGDGLSDSEEKRLGTNLFNPDTDGDGLIDLDEITIGSDPLKSDTDGDRLSDGFEVNLSLTDPLKKISDGQNISDDLRDEDNDGLNNYEESIYNGNPNNADSDGDLLLDIDEIGGLPTDIQEGLRATKSLVYNTMLFNSDSDSDGLLDGTEINCGLDPNKSDSKGDGVKDSERYITQKIDSGKITEELVEKLKFKPSIEVMAKGDANNSIYCTTNRDTSSYIPMTEYVVGEPLEIAIRNTSSIPMSMKSIKVKLNINKDIIKSNGGLDNLQIAYRRVGDNNQELLNTTKVSDTELEVEYNYQDEIQKDTVVFYIINKEKYKSYYIAEVENFNTESIGNIQKDIVLLLDTTTTMKIGFRSLDGEIDNFIKEVYTNPNNRVAMLEYKDIDYPAYGYDCHYNRGWLNGNEDYLNRIKFLYCKYYDQPQHTCDNYCPVFVGGGEDGYGTDYKESAIDGLYHAYDYYYKGNGDTPFRPNVEKHVLLVTDNGFKSGIDNNDLFGVKDILDLYVEAGIKISVVAPETTLPFTGSFKALEQFKVLYEGTGGIGVPFYKYGIDNDLKSGLLDDDYKYKVRLVDGQVVTLDKNPNLGDVNYDSDKDGIADLTELKEKKIINSMGEEIEVWDYNSDPTQFTNNNYSTDNKYYTPGEVQNRTTINIDELNEVLDELYSYFYYKYATIPELINPNMPTSYAKKTFINKLILSYMQSGQYNDIIFDLVTDGFRLLTLDVEIVKPHLEQYKYVDLKVGQDIIDLPHTMVNINALTAATTTMASMFVSPHNSGFIGDLQQSIAQGMIYSEASSPEEFTDFIINTVGKDKIKLSDGKEIDSYFSKADFISDVDAVNIVKQQLYFSDIRKAFDTYYSDDLYLSRGKLFIKNLGRDNIKKDIVKNIPRNYEMTKKQFEALDYNNYKIYSFRYTGIWNVLAAEDKSVPGLDQRIYDNYDSELIAEAFVRKIENE